MGTESHKKEIETVAEIFKKSAINFLTEVDINIQSNKTDIDVFGITGNIAILVECVGAKTFGEKMKKTVTDLNTIKKNFPEVKKILQKEYPNFYNAHKASIDSIHLKFVFLIVTLEKETKDSIDEFQRNSCEENNISIWTREELYYYSKVADCTYDHCKYEIFGYLNISPEDIEGEESMIPSYVSYGKQIKEGVYLLNLVVPVKILLKRSTIRRLRDSSTEEGYQRLLDKKKLKAMRKYLLNDSNTYPNNIICVLNKESSITQLDEVIETIEFKQNEKSRSDNIKDLKKNVFLLNVPNTYNVFEIVDGQHRVFSFSQTGYSSFENMKEGEKIMVKADDDLIRDMAETQSLTITAIFSTIDDVWSNPGKLFLDINTKQTKISPEDVIDIVEKYDKENNEPIINANLILKKLNDRGFLNNKIKFKPWQDDRIKRTSLISYSGLKDIFDTERKTNHAFMEVFTKQNKIAKYEDFCFIVANNYFQTFKDLIITKSGRGHFDKIYGDTKFQDYYLLSAVFIGALFRLLRHFMKESSGKINIPANIGETIDSGMDQNDCLIKNLDNKKLQKLFSEGISVVVDELSFTKEEFDKKEGWGTNKWSKIEADLFYLIRNKKDEKFGDESLIGSRYKKKRF